MGDPLSQAKIYEAQAADELIFLDLDASREGRSPNSAIVSQAAQQIFMPFTVGGGVATIEHIRELLQSGADKVSLNSGALRDPELISRAADRFGSQCVVVSIDYRRCDDGVARVFTDGGNAPTGRTVLDWAQQCERLGAGEILLTSVDRDGTRTGLDLAATRSVCEGVRIPVITSGGCGSTAHLIEGFREGLASAVSAGTYFCSKDENPMQARAQICNAGIPIRLHS